jgi:hypothetical protein
MDPFLERNPQWQVFHGWFIRKLAEQSMAAARELGCVVDVERSVYGRESTGELVLFGEPDVLVAREATIARAHDSGSASLALAQPKAVHEVSFTSGEDETYKQEYVVVREEDWGPVLAVVELLSFANKTGPYRVKYQEKRSRFLASGTHFMEIDFLRAGENSSRDRFPELPSTAYFIYVARKFGWGRQDEGYPLRLQDPLPRTGLPLGPNRPDLPMDLAQAFRAAYELSYRRGWFRYEIDFLPEPAMSEADVDWVKQIIQHKE